MTRYDPESHHRRSIRLRGFDYTREGAYFVTICTRERACLFGEVVDGEMRMNEAGRTAQTVWHGLPDHYPNVELDAWVVMPNHVHGIVVLVDPAPVVTAVGAGSVGAGSVGAGSVGAGSVGAGSVGAGFKPAPTIPTAGHHPAPMMPTAADYPVPAPAVTTRHGLSEIVRAFKTFSARHINTWRGTPGVSVWQRNYYEHIIRDDAALHRIRDYIATNPAHWADDAENPEKVRAKDISAQPPGEGQHP